VAFVVIAVLVFVVDVVVVVVVFDVVVTVVVLVVVVVSTCTPVIVMMEPTDFATSDIALALGIVPISLDLSGCEIIALNMTVSWGGCTRVTVQEIPRSANASWRAVADKRAVLTILAFSNSDTVIIAFTLVSASCLLASNLRLPRVSSLT
jgi:hypothetical protein